MLSMLLPLLLCLICSGLVISAPPSRTLIPLRFRPVHAIPSRSPRLVWQADFAGQEILRLGPSGAGKIVVFAAPPFDVDHGDWNSRPLTVTEFILVNGRKERQIQIAGLPSGAVADAKRWYAAIPLPLPRSNKHEIKPEDSRSELVAYSWASGHETGDWYS